MALNFPNSPTLNQVYTDSTSGFSYQWNGTVWISYEPSTTSNISELDNISGSFNNSTTIFPLTIGGQPVSPASTNQLIISVGGVMQNPTDDFYISGTNIVFTTAPLTGLTFFGILLGTSLPLNTIADGTVTPIKLSTGGPLWNTDGDVVITGVVTATSFSGDGSGLTGVGPSGQDVTSVAGITTVDLSAGNVIYFTHDTDTTVAFANTSTTQEVTFIRTKDDTETARSITWPSSVRWPNFGDPPVLQSNSGGGDAQTFKLVTRDSGVTWYAWEEQIFYGLGQYLFAWGTNSDGRLGQNDTTQYSSPVQIPGTSWSSISGDSHSLATKTDGTLWSWGTNNNGELGQNNTTRYSSPVQIPGTSWSSISGDSHSLATKTDGTLWSWGYNNAGRLGQNNTTRYSSPVQIPGTTWSSISGDSHSLATKTDGTLWSWGTNNNGELGQNDTTQYSSPVQIPGTSWSSIGSGSNFSLATKTDGTLWSWGLGSLGRLGQNDTIRYSSPVQIPGTSWSSISGGDSHSLATKTDGTLWSWGYNGFGQLGQNNRIFYSSPVQIPGTTWSTISGGANHSLATKTDGTLWSWGYNGSGRLGQNTTTNISSPVQIPGTTWSSISGGSLNSSGLYIVT